MSKKLLTHVTQTLRFHLIPIFSKGSVAQVIHLVDGLKVTVFCFSFKLFVDSCTANSLSPGIASYGLSALFRERLVIFI